jgi:two-component system LytT family sensor kinase
MWDYFKSNEQLRRWALIFACWTAYALHFATYDYLGKVYDGTPVKWGRLMLLWLTGAYIWALLTPLIIWLARRFPVTRQNWYQPVLFHTGCAVLFACLVPGIFTLVYQFLLVKTGVPFSPFKYYQYHLVFNAPFNPPKYWIIVGLVHTFDYYRKYRERELKASQLETRLAQAQLEALRTQLHPHFLFNTLNSIAVLMRKDVEAADRMLLQLSNLLRMALSKNQAHEIPLKQELEFLERYLEIEQLRFQDRLTVQMEVDPAALPGLVPQLIFQPLVENAIKHGLADRETDGLIEIQARRHNGHLHLQVRDNGPGLAQGAATFIEGIGLSNTRARLEHLYGSDSKLELHNAETGGLIVTTTIPFHTGSGTWNGFEY